MNKFTHFPWFAVQPDHAHGWWVVSHDEYGDMCVDESGDGGFREETARLIAAAPDLLDALELADAMLRGANMNANVVQKKVTAAIAKARGDS